MSATTERIGYEVIRVTDRDDGLRVRRYRWREDPNAEGTTTERVEPVSREVLEDRYQGLVKREGEATKLLLRLDRVLNDIAEGVIRRELGETIYMDGKFVGSDVVMDIDRLEEVIREWMLERAAKPGVAL